MPPVVFAMPPVVFAMLPVFFAMLPAFFAMLSVFFAILPAVFAMLPVFFDMLRVFFAMPPVFFAMLPVFFAMPSIVFAMLPVFVCHAARFLCHAYDEYLSILTQLGSCWDTNLLCSSITTAFLYILRQLGIKQRPSRGRKAIPFLFYDRYGELQNPAEPALVETVLKQMGVEKGFGDVF